MANKITVLKSIHSPDEWLIEWKGKVHRYVTKNSGLISWIMIILSYWRTRSRAKVSQGPTSHYNAVLYLVLVLFLIRCSAINILLMLSSICLLMISISDLLGLISLQVGLFIKSGLWSFMVINESLLAETSFQSSSPSLSVTFLLTEVMTSATWFPCIFVHNRHWKRIKPVENNT